MTDDTLALALQWMLDASLDNSPLGALLLAEEMSTKLPVYGKPALARMLTNSRLRSRIWLFLSLGYREMPSKRRLQVPAARNFMARVHAKLNNACLVCGAIIAARHRPPPTYARMCNQCTHDLSRSEPATTTPLTLLERIIDVTRSKYTVEHWFNAANWSYRTLATNTKHRFRLCDEMTDQLIERFRAWRNNPAIAQSMQDIEDGLEALKDDADKVRECTKHLVAEYGFSAPFACQSMRDLLTEVGISDDNANICISLELMTKVRKARLDVMHTLLNNELSRVN